MRLLERAGITGVETVAEIGCGDGAVLDELARRGTGVSRTGMDISSSALAIVRPARFVVLTPSPT